MSARTQEDLRILAGAVVVPAVLGLALSVIWWAAGGDGTFYMTVSLPWLPFAVGLLISALLLPALVTLIAMRRHVEQVRRRTVQEQTASRRRLLARLDHEIKNPIQGIRAALADEPSERQRASIDAQSQRLTSLLGDLRKIGEVEHTALELTTIDPAALVEEAVATITEAPGAGERRIAVSLPTAPRPLPPIVGDEDLLFLALVNVLTNAVKYSAPGDAIEVRGRAAEDVVVLEIADTGRGIATEELDLVWEELGRAQEARSVDGSGLGLPMVRAIVERHGGTARLDSWHGEGSTLTLSLPTAGPTAGG